MFRPPPKLLIAGAFATGKTTLVSRLAEALAARGLRAATVPEVARTCPFPLNREQHAGSSAWLLGEQVRREVEASLGGADLVVCDRGAPDILSHARWSGGVEQGASRDYAEFVWTAGAAWGRTYDHVLWAKIDSNRSIESDGLRVADPSYQIELQESIAAVLVGRAYTQRVIELPRDDAARLAVALDAALGLLRRG